MRYIFNFPDIGEGLEEGTILEWYVSKGQEIKSGQPLVNMETDKVVTDIPSPKSGVVVALFGEVGETIKVGSPLVEIEMEGVFGEAAVAEAAKPVNTEPVEEAAGVVGTLEVAGNNAYLPASDEGASANEIKQELPVKALATPLARAMAKDMGIDINKVKGTGPSGRVTKSDLLGYKEQKDHSFHATATKMVQKTESIPADDVVYEPVSQIRKAIARNMMHSKQNAAHMTIFEEADITELMQIRQGFNQLKTDEQPKLTYLPFIIRATVQALKHHRLLNAQLDLDNERMIYHNRYNVGIAVDTAEGLVVPVVKDADKLSIVKLAESVSALSEKARDRKLQMDEMKDGTFTLTNYGSIGGIYATPVINYPQAGILGIGRIVQKPVVRDNQVVPGYVLPLSLTVDHRIVDGGEASRFLNEIIKSLTHPYRMLLE